MTSSCSRSLMRVLALCAELLQALQGVAQNLAKVSELIMEAEALRLLEMLVVQPASSAPSRIKARIANVQLQFEAALCHRHWCVLAHVNACLGCCHK
jgi:hypothetical protein